MEKKHRSHYYVDTERGHDIYMRRHAPGYHAPSLPEAGIWPTVDQMRNRVREALNQKASLDNKEGPSEDHRS